MPAGPHRSIRGLIVMAAAAATVALAGCGSDQPTGPGGTPTTPTTSATPATLTTTPTAASSGPSSVPSSVPGSLTASPLAPDGSGATGPARGEQSLTGRIEDGVESGCTVLVDEAGTVLANLLDFDPAGVDISGVVTVSGTFNPDLMTTCQQGRPFEVSSVRAG